MNGAFLQLLLAGCFVATLPAGEPELGSHIQYVPLPADLSRQAVADGGQTVRDRLYELARRSLPPASPAGAGGATDLIVVFTDLAGAPILPDLERTRNQRMRYAVGGCPTGELTFTFNSSSYPWSPEELAVVNEWLTAFYPVAKSVCGNPFFTITVNVRKDPTLTVAGFYAPSLNEMVVRGTNSADVVCHELIHAFRDDYLMGLASFEEGMTRAAEVEVFGQLAAYTHWDEQHSYGYDVYYEGNNRQSLGTRAGSFPGLNLLLRYQIAGYAWGKCLLENPAFLADFNCQLFQRTQVDSGTPFTESKLVAIAMEILPEIEGVNFATWYRHQGIFNTDPPTGVFLAQRINQFTVDSFARDEAGMESPRANARIDWTLFDHADRVLDSGSGTTGAYGWIDAVPHALITNGYAGRIRLVAQSATGDGALSHTAYRATGPFGGDLGGVFGVVTSVDTGTLTVTALDEASVAPVTVQVVNGAFAIPALGTNRGRFLAEFRYAAGGEFTRRFNKDASNYFLELRPPVLLIESAAAPQIRLVLAGELDQAYQIEATTNFAAWEPVVTLTNTTGEVSFSVTNAPGESARFYRARR